MRRLLLALASTALLAAPAAAQTLSVRADQAVRIALSAPAKDVAVGNPEIADVMVLDERNILVLGKGFGTTNVIALDRSGRLILDRVVVVSAADAGQVTVYKGASASRYACAPRCEVTDKGDPAPAAKPVP
ncbi:MAG: pilus assembly protein CpaC [Caulobacteraceae bacterium]|nr:pilus assembly protein N-terminal domain-containing protein [Caulobacter sp.]RYF92017.1 MAG: pilus assembly protein CpaC [Caulobacteraceae bacterium]